MSNLLLKFGYKLYVKTPFGPLLFRKDLKKAADKFDDGNHSQIKILKFGCINISIIPYSLNNYGFILWNDGSSYCVIVDPGFSGPFRSYLEKNRLSLKVILITHKHHDHCFGVKDLLDIYPDVKVYGSAEDHIKYATHLIGKSNGLKFTFVFPRSLNQLTSTGSMSNSSDMMTNSSEGGGARAEGRVVSGQVNDAQIIIGGMLSPGHTVGHVIYSVSTSSDSFNVGGVAFSSSSTVLPSGSADEAAQETVHPSGDINYAMYFTGDCIFTASIGRMFECKAEVFYRTIHQFLESLLEHNCSLNNIMMFPAHEYSVDNLKFLCDNLSFGDNSACNKLDWCRTQREGKSPTIPTTLTEEISYNPYLQIVLAGNDRTLYNNICSKFKVDLTVPTLDEIFDKCSFPELVRKRLTIERNSPDFAIKLFGEVRKLRDSINFKD